MKKIPTLFERVYDNHKVVGIKNKVAEGMEWVLKGEGTATVKYDGSCCAMIDGIFYKRYDAKKGKTPPDGAIPCCEPDPITGHHPHWVPVDIKNPNDKWFIEALKDYLDGVIDTLSDSVIGIILDGTYEAIGVHFNGNPYSFDVDTLTKHGMVDIRVERSFEGIMQYLNDHEIEGIVFWKEGKPQCKIKRSDFGFDWPIK